MNNMRLTALGAAVVAMAAAILACSSDDPPASNSSSGSSGSTSSSSGSSGSSSSGSSGSTTSSSGSSGSSIGDCGDKFVDRSAPTADRTLIWDIDLFSRENRCMQIAVGQKVKLGLPPQGTAAGDFLSHPPTVNGGDTPNPFGNVDKTTGEVTFDKAGTYGYKCDVHGSMVGAIRVK